MKTLWHKTADLLKEAASRMGKLDDKECIKKECGYYCSGGKCVRIEGIDEDDDWVEVDDDIIITMPGVVKMQFSIVQQPGCCAYGVICNYSFKYTTGFMKDNPDWVVELVKVLEECVAKSDFPFAMIQTVKIGNHKSQYNRELNDALALALEKRKWKKAHSGKNYKSNNTVITWVKRVSNTKQEGY